MSKTANDVIMAAITQGGHPVREAIERVLRAPDSIPGLRLEPGQPSAIATDILQALYEIDLGDMPSTDLRRRCRELEAENNGLVLALARLAPGSNA